MCLYSHGFCTASFHPDFHNPRSKVQREMIAYMRQWVQGLSNQHEVLHRLSKQAVRSHENIRRAGEGGMPESQGSYAHNQGIQMQHNIQGYASSIPIVGQAQQLMGQFSGGPRREMPSGHQMPGAKPTPGTQTYEGPGSPPPPPPSSGEAASFYSPGPLGGAPSGPSTFSPPSGPPSSFPDAPSGNAPPGPPGGYPPPPGGYAPSYSSPPSFPDYNPTGGYGGSYTPPPGGPGFPGPSSFSAPPGPPPGFPLPPGPPPGQGGYPPDGYYGGGGW